MAVVAAVLLLAGSGLALANVVVAGVLVAVVLMAGVGLVLTRSKSRARHCAGSASGTILA
ncbi:hypothetical protein [Bifidobacterium sp. ESL0790]|uniref:hypothetical protein n=1 Tax=Bifidobacterium sp. ESL0790 TaxID=2983233 RepID=UPI0023F71AEF|nr:hypothetical protein [Bifidobacterium sp. ESL0790]WEV72238.1 hypothetical protein OZY47_07340 [Bifidobacterium sp. ESL0790]